MFNASRYFNALFVDQLLQPSSDRSIIMSHHSNVGFFLFEPNMEKPACARETTMKKMTLPPRHASKQHCACISVAAACTRETTTKKMTPRAPSCVNAQWFNVHAIMVHRTCWTGVKPRGCTSGLHVKYKVLVRAKQKHVLRIYHTVGPGE